MARRRWVRWTRGVLVALLILVVAAHVAGGWLFSSTLERDALRVDPYDVELDLRVDAVTPDRVTLVETGERRDEVHRAGIWGLEYAGGFAQLTGAPQETGDGVTWAYDVILGEAPTAEAPAGIDIDAFPDDLPPEAEQVSYETDLGPAPATFFPGEGDTWAVLVHGKGGSIAEQYRMAQSTVAQGLPTLSIAYRGDPGAPDDPSGRYQFGVTEWADLADAVGFAQSRGAEQIVLGGNSMGGGIIASYLERTATDDAARPPGLVIGLVLDSPMLNFARTVELGASQQPIPPPPTITWAAKMMSSWRFDVDFTALDYLDDTAWASVPTLVFHGDADTTVPLATSQELARADADVRLVVFPDVEHVRAWNVDRDRYDSEVDQFLADLTSG